MKTKMEKINDNYKEKAEQKTESPSKAVKNRKLEYISQSTVRDPEYDEKKIDPFKRTGKMFGCLFKEVKYRYSQFFSDIRDGINLHCFIAAISIFTVCFAPALCFGGILGRTKIFHLFRLICLIDNF